MAPYLTSLGHKIPHCHVPGTYPCRETDFTPAEIEARRKWLKDNFPCVQEILPPTITYNCFGYALAYSHGWFGQFTSDPVELLIHDDFAEIDITEVQVEDVAVYREDGLANHAAIIDRVKSGKITRVRGKFGNHALGFHRLHDKDVTAEYGLPVQFLRRLPRAERAFEAGVLDMSREHVSAINSALNRLSDRDVNLAVGLASTSNVAKKIIQSLPGVKELKESGPEAGRAVLTLLQQEETLENEELSAIALYILESYPSEEVKLALAKEISALRFRMINAQLAAETFLNAAGIQFAREDAVALALREARKLYPRNEAEASEQENRRV